MTGLTEVQRLFAGCLDGSAGVAETAHFYGLLAPRGALTPAQRVAVYRGSSREARLSTLDEIFPVCRTVLGERCFRGLASAYLDETPSSSGDLNRYGDAFPEFLGRSVRNAQGFSGLDYLADLACLEWHWHASYYAADDPPFDLEGFARDSAGEGAAGIRFRLASSLRLLASDFPVHEIWRRHRGGEDTASVSMGSGDRLVIRREGYVPLVEAVVPGLFELLAAIAAGRMLGELDSDGLDLQPLPGLISDRWIVGY